MTTGTDRARLGILMLDTRFPRIPGDIGNPDTWPFPVRYRIVRAASPARAVQGDPEALLADFIREGRALVAEGCTGITTTCGFLTPLRARLCDALGVPVATSALEQVPMVQAMLPAGRRVGVVTISAASLTPAHLSAAGAAPDTPIAGTDGGRAFSRSILGNEPTLDVAASRADVVDAALALVQGASELGAIVLECTNMPPYAADVAAATGLPVFSVYTYLLWFEASLAPAGFAPPSTDPARATIGQVRR